MIKVTVTRINARSSARQPRSVVVRVPGPQGPSGTANLGTVTVVNPDQTPNVTAGGTARDRIYNFFLPRAPAVTVGNVTAGADITSASVTNVGTNGDVVLDFVAPRATVNVGTTTTVNPDVAPSVANGGTDAAVVLDFDLPRAPTFTVGTVITGAGPTDAVVTDVGTDGDIQLDFTIPRTTVNVGATTVVKPNESPDVLNSGDDADAIFDFNLPRTPTFSVEPVTVLNPDQNPGVSIDDDADGDYELTFDFPRAPTFTVGEVTTTLPGTNAAFTNVGTDGDIVLDIEIPRGDTGDSGAGVPSGGNENEIIVKTITGSTEWRNYLNPDRIEFDINTVTEVSDAGVLAWNANDGTLDLGLNGGNVILQLGQEVLYRVKNQTGFTINNGTLVQFAGTVGLSGILLGAPSDTANISPEFVMGVATQDILDGEDGYVTHFGKLRGIDTSAWDEADILYADPSVVGGLTNIEPSLPNVQIAAVITKSATVGEIFVRPTIKQAYTTDQVNEGATNLYYTDARVEAIAAPLYLVENLVTANYTLALSDVSKVVAFDSTSALTLTVPANASVAFPIGSVVNVYRQGTGGVTIAAAAGVTIRNIGPISSRFGEASLRKRGTDEWVLVGLVD